MKRVSRITGYVLSGREVSLRQMHDLYHELRSIEASHFSELLTFNSLGSALL